MIRNLRHDRLGDSSVPAKVIGSRVGIAMKSRRDRSDVTAINAAAVPEQDVADRLLGHERIQLIACWFRRGQTHRSLVM